MFFVLPFINYRKVKNFFWRHLIPKSSTKPDDTAHRNLKECGVCEEWPFNPHEIGCSHVFCYYCIKVFLSSNMILIAILNMIHVTGLQIFHLFSIQQLLICSRLCKRFMENLDMMCLRNISTGSKIEYVYVLEQFCGGSSIQLPTMWS